jgi:hypothetical protein
LHVLSTPPAFVLSQDQTLQQKLALQMRRGRDLDDLSSNWHKTSP